MDQTLVDRARRLQQAPWNRPGSDKAWVLAAQSSYLRLLASVRRVASGGVR